MLHLAAPSPDLVGIVEAGIVVRQPASTSVSRFPAMPRAMVTVVQETGSVAFHTLSTHPVGHVHSRPFDALGLVLPPATAARLMGLSTGALIDATVPWSELAGVSEAARLGEALDRADSAGTRLLALQDSLRRVLSRGPERVRRTREEALALLCGTVGLHGAQAALPLGIGERHLERRCRALLGLTPKQLQRLVRFHTVLAAALVRQRLPDADAALAAGYYDQSHLAREALRLAGAPMRELLSGARVDGAWWPLSTQQLAGR